MNLNYLKILAMESCVNSDLSTSTKKKHLNYIKEHADMYQCMGYILDEKIYNLTRENKEEVKYRFLKESRKTRKTVHSVAGAGSGALGAGGILGLYYGTKKYGTKKVEEELKRLRSLGQGSSPEAKKLEEILNKIKSISTQVGKADAAKFLGKSAAVGAAGWAAYRGIRAAFDKCTRKCGVLNINTPERQRCLDKCKAEFLQKRSKLEK